MQPIQENQAMKASDMSNNNNNDNNNNNHEDDSNSSSSNSFVGRPGMSKDFSVLSTVSKQFDIGNKGFLTASERVAREMDVKGEGRLPNEQVVALIERTEDLQRTNKVLRRWMVGLLIVTVVLGMSQMATAIAAARLSKDTSVNSNTGRMYVQGSNDIPVTVVASGETHLLVQDPENGAVCLSVAELSKMWATSAQGTTTNAIVRQETAVEADMATVSFSRPFSNATHACLYEASIDDWFCITFGSSCGNTDNNNNRRRLSADEGRRLFHQHVERHLCFFDCGSGDVDWGLGEVGESYEGGWGMQSKSIGPSRPKFPKN